MHALQNSVLVMVGYRAMWSVKISTSVAKNCNLEEEREEKGTVRHVDDVASSPVLHVHKYMLPRP